VSETLLCLNSEWHGCTSPILEAGSRRLAAALFGATPFLDFGPPVCSELTVRDGVFALDCVVRRFRHVLETLEQRDAARVVTVGGTCGAEAAPVAYLNARHGGRLGVLWLDAHGDLNTPASSPSGHFHGMVLRTLLGEGPGELIGRMALPLDPERLVLAGVRDLDESERRCIEAQGIRLIRGWPESAGRVLVEHLRRAGVRHLVVHLDVDVFDPQAFGDALFSVPGGPGLGAVAAAVRALKDAFEIVGVGVVEYCGRMRGSAAALCRVLAEAGLWPPGRPRPAGGHFGSEAL
jgi:arginase